VTSYNEPLPLIGLMVAPLWGIGSPPALIYNLALLATLVLNGAFAYRLARALEILPLPALLGGVLMVMLPFVSKVQGVLPNMALFGMLWTLDGLVRFGRCGTRPSAVWAGLGFLATYLTMQQYAYFFAPFAAVAGVVALASQHFTRRAALRLAAAGLVAALLVLLLALPSIRQHSRLGFRRPQPVVEALSAHPGDFLTRPETALFRLPAAVPGDTAGLFPGVLLLGLAVYGTIYGLGNRDRRTWTVYLVGGTVAAAWLALGMNLSITGWRPFESLRAFVPGMDMVRSPFRFAALIQLCLAILAAQGLAGLAKLFTAGRAELVVLLALLAAAENLAVPAPLVAVPVSPQTPWTAWLRAQPESTVVAHVPFPSGLHVSDYEIETWRMFAQIDHHKRLVNGYSSYFPQVQGPNGVPIPAYTLFQLRMARLFPDGDLLCSLSEGLGANILVVDRSWLEGHQSQMETYSKFLQSAYSDTRVQIYRLQAPAGECQP
jgi:hypothetical protein